MAKPAGLPVHRSKMVNERDTVMRAVRRQMGPDVSPVHRLDRPTSGCLLLSLDRSVTGTLQRALKEGTKQYLAFVRGHAIGEPTTVSTPMKDSHGVLKEAQTHLTPLVGSDDPRCSLILARPATGRFHQVRRHCRDLSHPVLGDSKHGDTKINRWWREHYALPRLGLHCLSLSLRPEGLPPVEASCPVPEDLLHVWRQMPWFDEAVRLCPGILGSPEADATEAS
ncbi:MAG: pseudouridylate synthase [Myxococcales bacterium]|nr:pseudouridylate synthase [Myxococcales bacterium]